MRLPPEIDGDTKDQKPTAKGGGFLMRAVRGIGVLLMGGGYKIAETMLPDTLVAEERHKRSKRLATIGGAVTAGFGLCTKATLAVIALINPPLAGVLFIPVLVVNVVVGWTAMGVFVESSKQLLKARQELELDKPTTLKQKVSDIFSDVKSRLSRVIKKKKDVTPEDVKPNANFLEERVQQLDRLLIRIATDARKIDLRKLDIKSVISAFDAKAKRIKGKSKDKDPDASNPTTPAVDRRSLPPL